LSEAREEALKLEKHAYKINPIYRQTQPADSPAPGTLGG